MKNVEKIEGVTKNREESMSFRLLLFRCCDGRDGEYRVLHAHRYIIAGLRANVCGAVEIQSLKDARARDLDTITPSKRGQTLAIVAEGTRSFFFTDVGVKQRLARV